MHKEYKKAIMHCQEELERDRWGRGFIPEKVLFKWFNERYSTSKHLLTLYTLARGLNARSILEVGFGRSSFVLLRAAAENHGTVCLCDVRDFQYLLTPEEKAIATYIVNNIAAVWTGPARGFDLAFLDYFSADGLPVQYCINELNRCLSRMKQNGIIAIHDTLTEKYTIHKALKEIAQRHDVENMTLPFNYGLTLMRYTGESVYGRIDDAYLKKDDASMLQGGVQ